MSEASLRITEIFFSLQGEAKTAGCPTVFVRLTGCPLRCVYCDSEYAFHGGERLSINDILRKVSEFGAKYVCVTGGEPLAQPQSLVLLERLCNANYSVSLETSGAMDVSKVDKRIDIVLDLKTPDSGELDKNLYSNLDMVKPSDQVKFVICSRSDYDWAKFTLDQYQISERVENVWFSPSYDDVKASELADWIIKDALPVRFQMQLHKSLWGDKPGV